MQKISKQKELELEIDKLFKNNSWKEDNNYGDIEIQLNERDWNRVDKKVSYQKYMNEF